MIASAFEFAGHIHRPRHKILTPFGWFIVLAIIAVAVGTVWGFAT